MWKASPQGETRTPVTQTEEDREPFPQTPRVSGGSPDLRRLVSSEAIGIDSRPNSREAQTQQAGRRTSGQEGERWPREGEREPQ